MTEITSDVAMWATIVAFFSPLVTSLVQQPDWSKPVRVLVAVLASVAMGLGAVYFENPDLFSNGAELTTVILAVVVASTASYQSIWKPAGVGRVEVATALRRPPAE